MLALVSMEVYPDRPWVRMELPVDELDLALFATTTKVTVNNGQMTSFWFTNWLDGGRLPFNSQSCLIITRGKGDRWQRLCPMINGLGMSCMTLQYLSWMSLSRFGGLIEDANFDSQQMEQDIIVWTRTTSEEYSAKPAYEM
jgi:hypothetical protein